MRLSFNKSGAKFAQQAQGMSFCTYLPPPYKQSTKRGQHPISVALIFPWLMSSLLWKHRFVPSSSHVDSQPCVPVVPWRSPSPTLGSHWQNSRPRGGLVHFISYNNSPTDAAEVKGLIKFHAPKCGLIIAGPEGDLFPVVLTGMGVGDQVRSVRFADHF